MAFLESYYHSFETKLNNFLDTPNWKTKIVIVSIGMMLLSFFNNFSPLRHIPEYFTDVFVHHKEYYIFQTIKDRAESVTHDWVYPPDTGMNNRTFRLTLPLFVKVFHIKNVSIVLYTLQLILGVVFFYLITQFFERYIQEKISVFYAVVAFSCIYVGTAFFIDIATFGDFFSYFFLFLAIYYRNPLLIFTFLSLAFWNDERAFIGSGFVLLWWWFMPQFEENRRFKIEINWQMLTIILSWGSYWLIRKLYLVKQLGMKDTYKEGEFWFMFDGSWGVWGFKFFWAYEIWWLMILLAFLTLILKKDWLRFLGILIAVLVMQLLSLTTYDSTRSGSFGFVVLFISLIIVRKNLTEKQLKILLFILAICCFLHPLTTRTNAIGFFLM